MPIGPFDSPPMPGPNTLLPDGFSFVTGASVESLDRHDGQWIVAPEYSCSGTVSLAREIAFNTPAWAAYRLYRDRLREDKDPVWAQFPPVFWNRSVGHAHGLGLAIALTQHLLTPSSVEPDPIPMLLDAGFSESLGRAGRDPTVRRFYKPLGRSWTSVFLSADTLDLDYQASGSLSHYNLLRVTSVPTVSVPYDHPAAGVLDWYRALDTRLGHVATLALSIVAALDAGWRPQRVRKAVFDRCFAAHL